MEYFAVTSDSETTASFLLQPPDHAASPGDQLTRQDKDGLTKIASAGSVHLNPILPRLSLLLEAPACLKEAVKMPTAGEAIIDWREAGRATYPFKAVKAFPTGGYHGEAPRPVSFQTNADPLPRSGLFRSAESR